MLLQKKFFIDLYSVSLCPVDELHGAMKLSSSPTYPKIFSYPKIPGKVAVAGNPFPPSSIDLLPKKIN